MLNMFCFQCEQTTAGKGCTKVGVCGKTAVVSNKQDDLIGALIGLARAADKQNSGAKANEVVMQGLFATITNVSFDGERIDALTQQAQEEKNKLGGAEDLPGEQLWAGDVDIVSLRSTLLLGLRGMAAYAWHAYVLGKEDPQVTAWFYKGLRALGEEHTLEEWLELLNELGHINLKCMELLDAANTETYGHPVPTPVSMVVEKGPFIVITGHDLHDLKQLLDQTAGKGINIYTHGEMLPAHGYPELKKYPHLKGHFGTAWHNQQREFKDLPAPILYTTNCLMPPRSTYADRIFTTAIVSYPGLKHIPAAVNGQKDFTPVIEQALELGGFEKAYTSKGINGGSELLTGFGHHTVLNVAEQVVEGVKNGAIKHFFLVGGCDGARAGRAYYTEFVKQTPPDSLVLTLGCGKFRFNDLQLGKIGDFPRLMDMGQCNDAHSAIQVAVALAKAFNCGVNELPLSIVLSWYEQKAVCILLSLLALDIKNIYLGPTLPAFLSPNVLKVLGEKYQLKPCTTPEADLKVLLS